jgi:hypothetical protein
MVGGSEGFHSLCEGYLDTATYSKIPGAIDDTFSICQGNKVGLYEKLDRKYELRSRFEKNLALPEAVEGAAAVDMQTGVAPWAKFDTAQ